MTYKYPIGSVTVSSRDCKAYFDGAFSPAGIITVNHGSGDVKSGTPLLIMGHGTSPGNSGSRLKAYAVMLPSGEIGYLHEGSLEKVAS